MTLKKLFVQATRALGLEIGRYVPEFPHGVVSLPPDNDPKGNVLLAYILEPFQRRQNKAISTSHTHHWESVLIAETWRARGYVVDVIDYRNHEFIPRKRYDYFVSARTHLESIAARLNPDCVKIAHFDTSHFAFNNRATYNRLLDAQNRRGVSLPGSVRLIEQNLALEIADYGVVLGDDAIVETYRYAGKPLFALSVTSVVDPPWNAEKDFARARNRFLWLGSNGLVHKGLDLVLEAFAGMPDMHLTVCGPVESETAFCDLYRRELYETTNIQLVGWVEISGEIFRRIADQCVAVVYPSCAEGQVSSIVNCMRAGVIPIVTRETGIPVGDFGLALSEASIPEIQRTVRQLAALNAEELARRAQRTWEYAAAHHSHNAYKVAYDKILQAIITDSKKRSHPERRTPM